MDRFVSGIKDAFGAVPKNKESMVEVKDSFAGELQKFPFLTKVEEVTKRKREEIVGAILLINFLLLMGGVFIRPLGKFMTRLFGFTYPAYKSFKAIESEDKEDDTQWLVYWMIFACFTVMEDIVLKRIAPFAPFFFVYKIFFLLWCYLPQTKGADFLYTEIVGPAMNKANDFIQDKLKPKEE